MLYALRLFVSLIATHFHIAYGIALYSCSLVHSFVCSLSISVCVNLLPHIECASVCATTADAADTSHLVIFPVDKTNLPTQIETYTLTHAMCKARASILSFSIFSINSYMRVVWVFVSASAIFSVDVYSSSTFNLFITELVGTMGFYWLYFLTWKWHCAYCVWRVCV